MFLRVWYLGPPYEILCVSFKLPVNPSKRRAPDIWDTTLPLSLAKLVENSLKRFKCAKNNPIWPKCSRGGIDKLRVPSELVIIIDYIIVDNEILAYDQETVVRSANLPRNPGSRILSWGTPPPTSRITDFGRWGGGYNIRSVPHHKTSLWIVTNGLISNMMVLMVCKK